MKPSLVLVMLVALIQNIAKADIDGGLNPIGGNPWQWVRPPTITPPMPEAIDHIPMSGSSSGELGIPEKVLEEIRNSTDKVPSGWQDDAAQLADEAATKVGNAAAQTADDAAAAAGNLYNTGTSLIGSVIGYTWSYGIPAIGIVLSNPSTAYAPELTPTTTSYTYIGSGRCAELRAQWQSVQTQIFTFVNASTNPSAGIAPYILTLRQQRDMLESQFNAHCQQDENGNYVYSDAIVEPPDENPFIEWTQDLGLN